MRRPISLIKKPDYGAMIFLLLLFWGAFAYTITQYVYSQEASEIIEQPVITAPYNPPPRPHKDGEVIVGRESFTVRLYIIAKMNISKIEVYGDVEGECIYPEGYDITFSPRESGDKPDAQAYRVDPDGSSHEVNATPTFVTYQNMRMVFFNLSAVQKDAAYDIRWRLSAPEELPDGVDKVSIKLNIIIKTYLPNETEPIIYGPFPKIINVVPPPILNYLIITGLVAAGFVLLIVAGYIGFFRMFSTTDLVTIAIISAMQAIWVHIIGRLLFFPILNRIPLTYNFAVGDFPYILLLITAVALIKKPGTVSLTLFVYNLSSQIMGFYSFNPAWWSYPIAEGLVPDIWILIRGDAILTDKVSFFKRKIPLEDLEKMRSFFLLKFIDGFIIGFMRGFTMQYTLYVVFLPFFYRISYSMGYVFFWMVIPWAIGNAIEGAVSIPIVEEIKKSVATL
ncbi:MAG: hypothetical protein Q6363_005665 [Candidatus Njordarchaeota archaeon]